MSKKMYQKKVDELTDEERPLYEVFQETLINALEEIGIKKNIELGEAKYKLDSILKIVEEEHRTGKMAAETHELLVQKARKMLFAGTDFSADMGNVLEKAIHLIKSYHENDGSAVMLVNFKDDLRPLSPGEAKECGFKDDNQHYEITGVRMITFVCDSGERRTI